MVASVFLFVVQGSMLVNALLILRVPETYTTGRLDIATSIATFGLYLVLAVWAAFLFGAIYDPSLIFALLCMAASIVVFVFALRRRRRSAGAPARDEARMPWWARMLAVAFIVAGTALIIASPFLDLQAELYELVGSIDGDWHWGLLLLGSPWSYLAQLALAVIVTPLSMSSSMTFTYGAVTSTTIVFAAAVLANIVIAVLMLLSPRLRVRAGNRFFRLTPPEPPA
jgi:hypothetical protein